MKTPTVKVEFIDELVDGVDPKPWKVVAYGPEEGQDCMVVGQFCDVLLAEHCAEATREIFGDWADPEWETRVRERGEKARRELAGSDAS